MWDVWGLYARWGRPLLLLSCAALGSTGCVSVGSDAAKAMGFGSSSSSQKQKSTIFTNAILYPASQHFDPAPDIAATISATAPTMDDIEIYTNPTCTTMRTNELAPFTLFMGAGLNIPSGINLNSQTSIYARGKLGGSYVTECEYLAEYYHDGILPSVSLSTAVPDPTNTNPIPVTVTFTEPVTGFLSGSIFVGGGTKSNFSGSGSVYSFDLIPSGDGPLTVDVGGGVAFDAAGNPNTTAVQLTRTYDGTAPAVPTFTSISQTSPNSDPAPYVVGTAASLDTSFVYLYNEATCTTQIGSGTRAAFIGGGLSAAITTNNSTTIYARAVDTANNWSACSTLLTTYVHDDIAPAVTGVSSPTANGTYGTSASIQIVLDFSEPVFVTATPTISLETGTTDHWANYTSGSSSAQWTFTYVVQAGDLNPDLDFTPSLAIALQGTIRDAANNNLNATLPTSLASLYNFNIDTIPKVTSVNSNKANGTYGPGNVIDVRLNFDVPVVVNTGGGTPGINLNNSGMADYATGSGTSTLIFKYSVQTGEDIGDLQYFNTSALSLFGGTIKDDATGTINADLTLPGLASGNSLGENKNITINSSFITSVKSVATGKYHSCAITGDNNLRCWGYNSNGQLGYGHTTNLGQGQTPAVAGDVATTGRVKQVGLGEVHTCVLLTSGDVQCWGEGVFGQLGYGDTAERQSPSGTVNLGGKAIEIAVGARHTCALMADKMVKCWGKGTFGQLGNAVASNVTSPTNTTLSGSPYPIHLTAGVEHTCALLSDGTVRCWGDGANGKLGYQNTTQKDSAASAAPFTVTSSGPGAIQLAAGESHTCALIADGSVKCWGNNTNGQLGQANTSTITNFADGGGEFVYSLAAINLGAPAIQITAGHQHTCAILSSGGVICWGAGTGGRLGYGTTTTIGDDEVPSGTINLPRHAIQIAAGGYHNCSTLIDGTVSCWGAASSGQLGYADSEDNGDNETIEKAGEVPIGGPGVFPKQLALGQEHSCSLFTNGKVKCWGRNQHGQLGYGNTTTIGDDEGGGDGGYVSVGAPIKEIATGYEHTCVLLGDGTVKCWGYGTMGRLGYNNINSLGDNELPSSYGTIDFGAPFAVKQLALGGPFSCALSVSGAVKCWGQASGGELGYGNTTQYGGGTALSSALTVNFGGGTNVPKQIASGSNHSCVTFANGNARCWGDSGAKQLGRESVLTIGDNESPTNDVLIGSPKIVKVALGSMHSCALLENGQTKCWGTNSFGELGYNDTTTRGDVSGMGSAYFGATTCNSSACFVSDLSVGKQSSCAIMADNNTVCWGRGIYGNHGYGNSYDYGSTTGPYEVQDARTIAIGMLFSQFITSGQHSCVILHDGTVKCWGQGDYGRCGYGNTNDYGAAATEYPNGRSIIF